MIEREKIEIFSLFLVNKLGKDVYKRQAQAHAEKVGKPVFVDFTGHGCVNCREMEARVWSDPRVLEILKRDYVICALYADDKKQVPEENWVTNDNGKVLKTLGKINSYFALTRYGVNAQPYYVLELSLIHI